MGVAQKGHAVPARTTGSISCSPLVAQADIVKLSERQHIFNSYLSFTALSDTELCFHAVQYDRPQALQRFVFQPRTYIKMLVAA